MALRHELVEMLVEITAELRRAPGRTANFYFEDKRGRRLRTVLLAATIAQRIAAIGT